MKLTLTVRSAYQSSFDRLIRPRTRRPDDRRREYVLNILLFCLSTLASFSLVAENIYDPYSTLIIPDQALAEVSAFWLFIGLLWWYSRRHDYRRAAKALVVVIAGLGLHMMIKMSFMSPSANLTLVLAIVIAGTILSARGSLWTTLTLCVAVLVIGYAQSQHVLHPVTGWLSRPLVFGDCILFDTTFLLAGMISWLANRAIARLFTIARQAEADLESKVQARTMDIKRLQAKRVEQTQRFVQFGRQSAGLLHDMSNALSALELNLEQLESDTSRRIVRRVQKSAIDLERYFTAARKQLVGQGEATNFLVHDEICQAVVLLQSRARQKSVRIKVRGRRALVIYGDPVKFNQIISNVLLNAIESYATPAQHAATRPVAIHFLAKGGNLAISVKDSGTGISPDNLDKVFEPLFTTKPSASRGMGLGLTMVKDLVEQDFGGRIRLTSQPGRGTVCAIDLPYDAGNSMLPAKQ